MTGAQMREALADGRRVYGTMLALARNPRWAARFAEAGLDYIIIDTEHSPFGRGQVADMIAAIAAVGIAPLVRVPIPDSHYVTMAMDAGAQGILAPYCETPEDVREVVGGVRWRPLKGALLQEALDTGQLPGELRGYLTDRNADGVVIIGVESVPAVENLEALLDVGEIDAIFIGPHDLSCSLGVPEQYEHPAFEDAIRRVIATCDEREIPVTVHFSDLRLAQKWIEEGVRLVLYASDYWLLPRALSEDFGELRRHGG